MRVNGGVFDRDFGGGIELPVFLDSRPGGPMLSLAPAPRPMMRGTRNC